MAARRMRERADGNEIHARRGDGGDGFQSHAAAGLELHADPRRAATASRHALRSAMLSSRMTSTPSSVRKRAHLSSVSASSLDADARVLPRGSGGSRPADAASAASAARWLSFTMTMSKRPKRWFVAAARDDRGFFQRAQAGRGLARVEDARAGAADGIDKAPGERGDAGEALEEIQRDAFRGEDRADGAR